MAGLSSGVPCCLLEMEEEKKKKKKERKRKRKERRIGKEGDYMWPMGTKVPFVSDRLVFFLIGW